MVTTDHSKPRPRLPADQRRAQILDAAVRVFSAKGFSGSKTKDIAAEAGVNEAILFRHFASKEDVYSAILDTVGADDLASSVREAFTVAGHDPRAFFREYVLRSLAWNRRRPELLNLVLYSALEGHKLGEEFRERQIRPVLRMLTDYIAEGQREGRFRTSITAEHAAQVLFGAVAHRGLVLLLLRGAEADLTDEETADAVADMTARGLEARSE